MDTFQSTEPKMSSPATYTIIVRGRLTTQWANWFNGTLIDSSHVNQGRQQTSLTCRVRDQAELLGILKQLNGLNLPLIQVSLVFNRQSQQGVQNDILP